MKGLLYQEVFEALNKNGVKYTVAGGVAVLLHGFVRFTADLDLIVLLDNKNLDNFYETLTKLDYKTKVPITKEQLKNPEERKKWLEEKNMLVFSFFHKNDPLKIIDMFIHEPIDFRRIYEERKEIEIDSLRIPIVSLEHLKKLKQLAGRPQDLIDLERLEEIEDES